MGQPTTRADAAQIFHVNFHTARNLPLFANPDYEALIWQALTEALAHWQNSCLAWQVMPTHIHLTLITFPDLPLGRIMRLMKGRTAHELMAQAPELRGELGDHPWQEGYDWVEITTQRQCAAAVRYVQENRRAAGLEE
jgi:REP element-mobilizing transposase RayT